MSIDEILTMMDEMIEKSFSMPLSGGKCFIDGERMRQMIDDIRIGLPNEIKQARMIVSDRSDIIKNAREEADRIIKKAEDRATQMTDEHEITKAARKQAKEIMDRTNAKCSEQMKTAVDFSEKTIQNVEETLLQNLKVVKDVKEVIKRGRQQSNLASPDNSIDIKLD